MFVIVTYDVSSKRVQRVLRICRRYLTRVQNSVFEGNITESKLAELKRELAKVVVPDHDGVRIYEMASVRYASLELLGKVKEVERIL